MITRSDPDYLALKAKGRRRVTCAAAQIVALMDLIIERDEEIARLKASAPPQTKGG